MNIRALLSRRVNVLFLALDQYLTADLNKSRLR
jgi:hypothetical protein